MFLAKDRVSFDSPVVIQAPPGFVVQAEIGDGGVTWSIAVSNFTDATIDGCVSVQWRLPEPARDRTLSFLIVEVADVERSFLVDADVITRMQADVLLWLGERACLSVKSGETIVLEGLAFCSPDVDGDGAVTASDVTEVLAAWGGPCGPADVSMDGIVDTADLSIVLSAWTPR